jgi:hypothetical protein
MIFDKRILLVDERGKMTEIVVPLFGKIKVIMKKEAIIGNMKGQTYKCIIIDEASNIK